MTVSIRVILVIISVLFPISSYASEISLQHLDLTQHAVGFMALFMFVVAYALVILEDQLHLKKSKPVLVAAGIIWLMIALVYQSHEIDHAV